MKEQAKAQAADSQPVEVEVVFSGVETPKRMQNAEDAKRNIVRHVFDVPASKIDAKALGALDGPNPRIPGIKKGPAKRLRESLEGLEAANVGAFHLAHGGVRGLIKRFEKVNDTTYRAVFEVNTGRKAQEDGIANGLHTIAVVEKAVEEGQIPGGQYLTFTLIENVDRELVPYIGEGLNTSIQVNEESIIDLAGAFDPFKESLADKSYANEIGWHENEPGQYDARDVFSVLNSLNVARYPNDNKDRSPIESYEKQSLVIKAFGKELQDRKKGERTSFESMIPILSDALYLYDWIGYDAGNRYKAANPEGSPGGLAIMEKRVGRDNIAIENVWSFPFISEGKSDTVRATYRLAKGARFAMLAAFRVFVEVNPDTGDMEWAGGFDAVLRAWQAIGGEMMMTAKDVSQAVNYNPQAVGKNRPFWRQLHQTAASYRLERDVEAMQAELAAFKAKA
jgi:hypothetical protein